MTRREKILGYLNDPKITLSCAAICDTIIREEKLTGNVAKYLNSSISSILAKMIRDKTLKYAGWTTPRGGHVYQINKKINL